jgi:hypothetical protein
MGSRDDVTGARDREGLTCPCDLPEHARSRETKLGHLGAFDESAAPKPSLRPTNSVLVERTPSGEEWRGDRHRFSGGLHERSNYKKLVDPFPHCAHLVWRVVRKIDKRDDRGVHVSGTQ